MTLKKLYSVIKIPKFDAIQNLTQTGGDQQSVDFEQVLELKWQEKIFSKTELSYYGQSENCKTEVEKKFHQKVKALPEGLEAGLLFTYTDDDKFLPPDNFGSHDLKVTKLRKSVEVKSEEEVASETTGLFLDTANNSNSTRYKCGNDFQNFYIMADLEPSTLLFTIKYRKADNLFTIFPDFNEPVNAYFLEIDQDSKQTYSYFIENLSATSNEATEKFKKKQRLDNLQTETHELVKKMNLNARDQNFYCPKFCRLVFMLEVISGSDFEFDNIHVRFYIKFPQFVKVVEGLLEAATQSSFRNENSWNFGYCHALIVDIDDEFSMSSTQLDLIEINFEVISVDSLWGRERNEGIASVKIPVNSTNNIQEFSLKCFRELQGGNWIVDSLERFFLGGIRGTQFHDHNQNGVTNFYGNQTVSTGTLNIKIQQIRQVKMSQRHNLKMQTIEEIINCYHKAKARLT